MRRMTLHCVTIPALVHKNMHAYEYIYIYITYMHSDIQYICIHMHTHATHDEIGLHYIGLQCTRLHSIK